MVVSRSRDTISSLNLITLIGALRIERRGVLVEQQQLGPNPRRHQQREGLALAARQAADRVVEAMFQSECETADTIAEFLAHRRLERPSQPARSSAPRRHDQVLRDRHIRRGARERVLEHASDERRAPVLRPARDVPPAEGNRAGIDEERPGNGVEQRRFAGAVRADHHDERAILDREIHALERAHLVRRARVERLAEGLEL